LLIDVAAIPLTHVFEASVMQSSAKVRATLYLPRDILEEARDAAVYLAGYPVHLTLTRLAEQAMRRELQRLKDLHHQGKDFPPRPEDLKGGRPIAA
jgi:post-segregation antitoxin (ccd killing protein)